MALIHKSWYSYCMPQLTVPVSSCLWVKVLHHYMYYINLSKIWILFKFFSIELFSSSKNDLQVKLCQHNKIQSTTTLWTCLTSVDHQNIILIRRGVDDFSVRPLPVQVIIEPTPPGFKGLGIKWQGDQLIIFYCYYKLESQAHCLCNLLNFVHYGCYTSIISLCIFKRKLYLYFTYIVPLNKVISKCQGRAIFICYKHDLLFLISL